ncbi:MAG: hemolysin family protein [Deltaproteobacteria bacterium]|jgi:CBS domain containing-hemolysin-like protein|nr:hemolysin family protein [Deltaproteobacteria bacterium]
MTELVIAAGFAIIVSAMCSLFEAVLYSVPISHIEASVQAGKSSGRILKKLRQNIDRPISAILSLNTIANTAGATIAGSAAAAVFGHGSVCYFSAFFTLCILLFSEVIPKTAGVIYSRQLSSVIARPLRTLVWVFTPMVWLCTFATRLVARKKVVQQTVSAEEIITMARLGRISGEIDPDEEKVIRNILLLKDKTAEDVMTPRPVIFSLSEHLTVEEASEKAGMWAHSRVPVYSDDSEDIVGIIQRRQILSTLASDKHKLRLGRLMKSVHFCPESMPLDKLLVDFLERRQHLFVVIDEFKGLAGVVSLEDVLEEILGKEIVDESDEVVDMRELARRRKMAVGVK